MRERRRSHEHDCVASLAMVFNKKGIVVRILYLSDFRSLVMLSSGNIKCSPHSAFQILRSKSSYFTDNGVDLFPDAGDTLVDASDNTLVKALPFSNKEENDPFTYSSHVPLQQVDSHEENDTTLTLRRSSRVDLPLGRTAIANHLLVFRTIIVVLWLQPSMNLVHFRNLRVIPNGRMQ